MADRYIDFLEVGEYGDHFVSESKKLDGLSTLVNVPALRDEVHAAVQAVDTELGKIGIKRSDLRGGREAVATATTEAKELVERFYYALRALPPTSGVDFEAFFKGKNLGNLSELKPADVSGKLGLLLKAFAVPANVSAAAALGSWQADLTATQGKLATALADKGGAVGTAITATAALKEAREAFLRIYNKVAKRLVYGLLARLGREDEYALFFKDLTVNEGGKAATEEEPKAPEAPAGQSGSGPQGGP